MTARSRLHDNASSWSWRATFEGALAAPEMQIRHARSRPGRNRRTWDRTTAQLTRILRMHGLPPRGIHNPNYSSRRWVSTYARCTSMAALAGISRPRAESQSPRVATKFSATCYRRRRAFFRMSSTTARRCSGSPRARPGSSGREGRNISDARSRPRERSQSRRAVLADRTHCRRHTTPSTAMPAAGPLVSSRGRGDRDARLSRSTRDFDIRSA